MISSGQLKEKIFSLTSVRKKIGGALLLCRKNNRRLPQINGENQAPLVFSIVGHLMHTVYVAAKDHPFFRNDWNP